MRILFLSTWYPYPPDNGSKIRAYYLLRALQASYDVTAVAFRPHNGASKGEIRAIPELDGMEVYPVPVDPFRYVNMPSVLKFASPIPLAFWPSHAMQNTVTRLSHTGSWDAVVAIQTPVARYALQMPGKPHILDVDTALSYQMRERYTQQMSPIARIQAWMSWLKAHRYEARLFRRFRLCTVVAQTERDYVTTMVSGSNSQVEVLPNGVDCQHNHFGLAHPLPHTLVFNGALTYGANYDAMRYFLAEVYPLIRQQLPDVSLTITGSTTGVNLRNLLLEPSVHLSGYVDDVRPLVAGASVCIVPLRRGAGTRLKILEAMALGTPVVSTSKGAEGLEVRHEEHLLLADTPAAFAKCTLQLLSNRFLRQRLATNARRLVEQRYDWVQIGRHFVELVRDVVAESPKRSIYGWH